MKTRRFKQLIFLLVMLLIWGYAYPVAAFDGRGGDRIVVQSNEVVEDDLYLAGREILIEGTVKGDLIAFGTMIMIAKSGIIEGDLMGAGQVVVIEGTVKDDARIAGAVLKLGEAARVDGDIVAAGYTIELARGSQLNADLVFAGGQALLAGGIAGDVKCAVSGLEITGQIKGNVEADVGEPQAQPPVSPSTFMNLPPGSPIVPSIPSGLKIGPEANIKGNLSYTAHKGIQIPAEVVGGQLLPKAPEVSQKQIEATRQATPEAKLGKAVLNAFLNFVSLLIVGFLLAWLLPDWVRRGAAAIQSKPLYSFGWGIVAYFGFFFVLFLLICLAILLVVVLGTIKLSGLGGTALLAGSASVSMLILIFKLAASYVSKILVGFLVGRLILARLSPSVADHRFWPMVIGVLIFAILAALPVVGWLVNLFVILLGLGALWLLFREWWTGRKTGVEASPTI